jgi:serine/threonine-protein kinase
VYKGFDAGIGRQVAIKTVRQSLQASPDGELLADRFLNEARAAGRLTHPAIVAVYELGQQDDIAFIAMEYVEGKDLSQILAGNPALSEAFVLKLMVQLLDALEYAHSHGVWHRDIKPANLVVMSDGRLKVTDFGIARIDSAALTQVTSTIGTPGYMAPEQYVGEKFDHRVDLFAAGVLLYRMLCGKPPFAGVAETVMYNIMNTEPQALAELLPVEMAAFYTPVVAQALAKNPANRYPSAAVFRAALLQRKAQLAASSADATVIVRPSGAAPAHSAFARTDAGLHRTGGSAGSSTPTGWEADQLAPVQAALSRCIGPLAKVVLRNAAKKCQDLPTLVDLLLHELSGEKERNQFLELLRKHEQKEGTGSGTGTDSQFPDSGFGVHSGFAHSAFGVHSTFGTDYGSARIELETLIAVASQVLVKHLGPIAKIVVRRASAKAKTPDQLMELICKELPGDAQRETFALEIQTALAHHTKG